jgi:hypothetical protein
MVADNVHQHKHIKLSSYDPADLHVNEITGQSSHLVFHADSIQKTNVEDSILVKTDMHFSKDQGQGSEFDSPPYDRSSFVF